MNITYRAWIFAKDKHKGQLDDEGKDYFDTHPVQVHKILMQITQDKEILCVGLLHDTLEDTETTYDELVENFGENIAQMVYMVTHDGQKDQHGYYFPRLNPTKHNYTELLKNAILVKLADRLSNVSRMDGWAVPRRAQYLVKTIFWKTKGKVNKDDPCGECNGENEFVDGIPLCAMACPLGVQK